jgi:hypothetical protein
MRAKSMPPSAELRAAAGQIAVHVHVLVFDLEEGGVECGETFVVRVGHGEPRDFRILAAQPVDPTGPSSVSQSRLRGAFARVRCVDRPHDDVLTAHADRVPAADRPSPSPCPAFDAEGRVMLLQSQAATARSSLRKRDVSITMLALDRTAAAPFPGGRRADVIDDGRLRRALGRSCRCAASPTIGGAFLGGGVIV